MSEKAENPNAFKHWFNQDLLKRLSEALHNVDSHFSKKILLHLWPRMSSLEMKPRVLLIRDELQKILPADYKKSLKIILKAVEKADLSGFDLWPLTEWIQAHGLQFPNESLGALRELTKRFTAEFAVRPFIVHNRKKTMAQLLKWTADPDDHVRRWTSEGTRPRLPWGMKLHDSIQDPTLGLQILDKLKFDDEIYVRKSVANHLNDITKDHPDLVVKTLKAWRKLAKEKDVAKLDWIQRHALRTLIKKGYAPAMSMMGFGKKARIKNSPLRLNKSQFKMNETLMFELVIESLDSKSQRIAIDYIIHYAKANGKTSPKVFKWKVLDLKAGEKISIGKNHALRPVTTRKHYAGQHRVEIQINGEIKASADWSLKI